MALRFFNTITRKYEEFKSIDAGKVRMYTCGPTVYNYAHIGNFRAYIFEDQLRRYLKFKGYDVVQVMNLTDVDDKIIRKCKEDNVPLNEYTAPYKKAFFDDIEKLNIEKAEHYPEATAHIPEMEAMIQTLLDKKLAYRSDDGNIFYKISSFKGYGRLQNLDMEHMRTGGRVSDDEYEKESVHDFALWKAWKEDDGDIFWDSPLGKGRPGWHIECSAMSGKYLGKTFDIHTGGVDNIFPHHENEIAQSEAANGQKFVNYWMHCEHLIWDNEKMSKSLGNIIYINGLVEKGYSLRDIRYALISTQYRQKLNFSLNLLDASQKALQRIDDFLYNLDKSMGSGDLSDEINTMSLTMLKSFEEAMDDDLNIARALASLFDLIKSVNKYKINSQLNHSDVKTIHEALQKIDTVLGIIFSLVSDENTNTDDKSILDAIERRSQARLDKDWALADQIRKELLDKGIELIDGKNGTDYKVNG